jgi:hypothetical protein
LFNKFYDSLIFADIVPYSRVWIGATDSAQEGIFTWTQNSEVLNFTTWHEGEPSGTDPNTGIEEDCVVYWNHDGVIGWNDVECGELFDFICEAPGSQ